MKKKVILSSILAIAMCVSVAIGATFALFTSTKSVNIAVTSGKVEVVANIASVKTYSMGVEQVGGGFANGGKVVVSDGDTVTLTDITPGDKVTFDIVVTNNSTVAIQYRTMLVKKSDDGLYAGLKYTVGYQNSEYTSKWAKLAPNSDPVVLNCALELPKTAGDIYQGKTCAIIVTVEAVQGNADMKVENVTIDGGDAETVNAAFENALKNSVTTDSTGASTATEITLPSESDVTFASGAASVPNNKSKDITISGDKTTTVKFGGSSGGSEGTLNYQDRANLTFNGLTIDASATAGIVARGGVTTFIDCKFVGELKKTVGDKFMFINCEFDAPVSQVGYGCKNVVFSGCKFNTSVGYGIKIYSEGNNDINVTVMNCEFKNANNVDKSAIFIDHIGANVKYNVSVVKCTFEGYTVKPTATYNRWAARETVEDSILQVGGQYVFSYQTGVAAQYHKILTADDLTVTVE